MGPYSSDSAAAPADTGAAPAPESGPSPSSDPARTPVSLESLRRSTIEAPAIGQKPIKEIRAEQKPQTREEGPAPESPATRLARLHRQEKEIAYREARAARTEEAIRQRTLAALPQQARDQYLAQENARAQRAYYAESLQHVQSDPETYELTNAVGWQNQVPLVIHEYFQRTGKILSHAAAARYVEAELERSLETVSRTRKAQALRARATGSNTALRSAKAPDWNDRRPLTEAERMRRAAAAMDAVSRRRKG